MKSLQRLTRISFVLGGISLGGLFFSGLALIDIGQAKEPDLSLEWNIIRISFLFIFMYIIISTVIMIKYMKSQKYS